MTAAAMDQFLAGDFMIDVVVGDELAQRWRASVDRLVVQGMQVGRASASEFGVLADDGREVIEFDAAIAAYKRDTEEVLAFGGPVAAGVPSLTTGLDAVDLLLQAAEPSEFGVLSADDEQLSVVAFNARLDAYVATMQRRPTLPDDLRASLTTKLDALQDSGADELVALGKSKTMWAALTGLGTGIVTVGGAALKEAVQAASAGLRFFQQKVMDLFGWIIERLRAMIPESFKDLFDSQLDKLKDSIEEQISPVVGKALALISGRTATESAWTNASASVLETAAPRLDDSAAGHLSRISSVGAGREKVDSIAAIFTAVAMVAAAPIGTAIAVVIGLAALVIACFVVWQVFDGFHDIKGLVEAP